MDSLLHIPHFPELPVYAALYASAFLIGSLLAFLHARRHGWPVAAATALICACVVGAIIGSKILAIPLAAWWGGSVGLPATSSKTLVGGLAGGIVAVAVARRLLRFPGSAADAFVWPVLLLVPVGRLGCLLAGCCFGRPAELTWAVSYGPGSRPFITHVAEGHIEAGALASMPVHPVPIYEIVFFALLAVIAWRWRNVPLAPGTRLYGIALLYSAFRFGNEFLRHTATLDQGLTTAQWGLLPAMVMLALLIAAREMRRRGTRSDVFAIPDQYFGRSTTVLACVGVVLWLGRTWFTPLEFVVAALIVLVAGVSLGLMAMRILHRRYPLKVSLMAALIVPAGLTVSESGGMSADTLRARHFEIGLGGVMADHMADVWVGSDPGCDGPVDRYEEVPHGFRAGGLELRHETETGPRRKSTLGLRAYGGTDVQAELSHPRRHVPETTFTTWGVNPYVRWDRRHFGVGLGIHVGQLRYTHGGRRDDNNEAVILPMIAVRLGDADKFFLDAGFGDSFPAGTPGMWWQAGAGAGVQLGPQEHLRLRAGTSDMGLYVNPSIRLRDRYTLYAQWAAGGEFERHVSLGLRYRIRIE